MKSFSWIAFLWRCHHLKRLFITIREEACDGDFTVKTVMPYHFHYGIIKSKTTRKQLNFKLKGAVQMFVENGSFHVMSHFCLIGKTNLNIFIFVIDLAC